MDLNILNIEEKNVRQNGVFLFKMVESGGK